MRDILDMVQDGPESLASLHRTASALMEAAHDGALAAQDEAKRLSFWYLKFIASITPAALAAYQRRFSDAFAWIVVGLSEDIKFVPEGGLPEGTLQPERIHAFFTSEIAPLQELFADVAEWGRAALYTSRAAGAFNEFLPSLLPLFVMVLRGPLRPDVGALFAAELCEWLLDHQIEPRLQRAAGDALLVYSRRLRPGSPEAAQVALALQGRIGQLVGVDREAYAASIRNHPQSIARLQVAAEDVLRGRGDVESLLNAISAAHADPSWGAAESAAMNMGFLFRVLHPVLVTLARSGDHVAVLRILCAWRNGNASDDLDESVAVWFPHTSLGGLLVGPSYRVDSLPGPGVQETTRVVNAFRAINLVVRQSLEAPDASDIDPSRLDLVTGNAAQEYEAALRAMLSGAFGGSSSPKIAAFAMIPFMPHPVQAVLSALGQSIPAWSTSLRRPRPDRRVRRVAVVATDATTEGMEIPWLETLLKDAGVEVVCHGASEVSPSSLQAVYEDGAFDVLWLTGHGEFSSLRPASSRLPLESGGEISFTSLTQWRVPEEDRRLLVINVCHGGMAPFLEGTGELGGGPRLAGPHQGVISHLWNTNWLLTPIWGALLLGEILRGGSFDAGFERALRALRSGKEGLGAALQQLGLQDAADRAARLGLDLQNLAHWGSPAFFQ
ncbi:hypothetical protein [Sorangium sp. So ce385]|uniref:hypothetical protein n=1 Tax=Sorangium sp. So ce385 TaxID=3133308 RepID=UPI003F5CA3FE